MLCMKDGCFQEFKYKTCLSHFTLLLFPTEFHACSYAVFDAFSEKLQFKGHVIHV